MVLFLSFIKKENVLQLFLNFLLYFCKRMDSLFLFQFACFIFMLVNAFIVALIRIGGFHPHFTESDKGLYATMRGGRIDP